VFGPDAPKFTALLAAMSPQTSVELNLRNALMTWKNWLEAGRPVDPREIKRVMGRSVVGKKGEGSVLDAWVNNSVRALQAEPGQRLVLSGPKVNSFMENLVGNVEEVTNDAWMSNFALVNQTIFSGGLNVAGTDPGKGPGYLAMNAQIRGAARELTKRTGVTWAPAEVQETVWSWAKALYESQKDGVTASEILYNEELTDDLIRSTPDFRTLFPSDANARVLRQAGYANEVDRLADEGPGADRANPPGQEAPFDSETQARHEQRAATRLERLKAEGEAAKIKASTRRQTETPEFKKWFGDSKVVDRAGNPLVVYHGTTNDFDAFDPAKANIEGAMGAGFYFSNTPEEVAVNYAAEGPDLRARIEHMADYMSSGEDITYEEAKEIARERLSQERPNTMPVYLSMQNPVILGGRDATFLDLTMSEEGPPTGRLQDFIEALEDVALGSQYEEVDLNAALDTLAEKALDYEGLLAEEVFQILRDNEGLTYATDTTKTAEGLAVNEILRQAFERAGFDGFIDRTVDNRFGSQRKQGQKMAGMNPSTVHYVVFRPEQIKSAIGNRGTFDAADPDVRASTRRPVLLNIGLSTQEVKGGGQLSVDTVRAAIEKLGAKISDLVVQVSDSEPTAVVSLNRSLTAEEGDALSKTLSQEAIVQRNPDGTGVLYGPQAANWGPFNPEYFVMPDGTRANEVKTSPRREIVGDSGRAYTPAQKQMFANTGRTVEKPTLAERITSLRKDLGKRLAQGIADQFVPIRDISKKGYMLARLSKGSSGAIEALFHHGKLSIDKDGVYNGDTTGGFIERVGLPLRGELEDFLWWVAGNRAERLAAEDRENLFTAEDIAAAKSLAEGKVDFDYVTRDGRKTRDRSVVYRDALKTFDEFNKNAMDMAEQSGLIDPESRKFWEHEFYVPFYRVSDDDRGFIGGNIRSGVVRQRAFKALKGGTDKINSDLLANTLQNWAHLIDAAAKNRAAKATLEAAANLGAATEAGPDVIRQMARSAGARHNTVWFMDGGKERHFLVEDAHLLEALNGLEFAGLRGPMMEALSQFKHWLTVGVTASPAFKVRNLIRDSVQAVAVSGLSYNIAQNIREGFEASKRGTQPYVSALASGALIRFGTMFEGNASDRVRQLVRMGVDESTILDSEDKIAAVRDKAEKLFMAYSEIGNRGEEINRSALFKQLQAKGISRGEAALAARDLMDFSMQGSWTSVRFLTQVVPFMNARIQGLYKLGRGAKEDPKRFAVVLGATALASLALLAVYHDDEDWKKREDWDRDNYWWFKIGGIAYRIPKPFEIGAIATLAERGVELFTDKEMTSKRFLQRVKQIALDQLSMNPIPQAVKPVLDIYSNKDSFTGRPIETMGMEKLRPDYRFTSATSMPARAIGTAGQAVAEKIGADFLSPVQIDHMVRGYLGWLGSFAVGGADMLVRPFSGEPTRPAADIYKFATQGILAEVPDRNSRYVTALYDQAKELDQAYSTWRALQKQGKGEEAREFLAENREAIAKSRQFEAVKKREAQVNERIRMVERSAMSPDEKKAEIRRLNEMKDRLARTVAPR
jgi:hypothetical protein